MYCISLALLSRLSWFPSPAVGANWPFCVIVPLNTNQSSIESINLITTINLPVHIYGLSCNITLLFDSCTRLSWRAVKTPINQSINRLSRRSNKVVGYLISCMDKCWRETMPTGWSSTFQRFQDSWRVKMCRVLNCTRVIPLRIY